MSEGSEWYQIDPKWMSKAHSCSFRNNLVIPSWFDIFSNNRKPGLWFRWIVVYNFSAFTVHWIWNLYLFLISCSFRRSSKRESICLSTEFSENSCVVLFDSLWCLMLENFILVSPWPSNISSYWFFLGLL